MDADYDVIIIGAGPAGLAAGLYAARGGLSTLIIDSGTIGGQISATEIVENYPGVFPALSGADLSQKMADHAKNFGAELKTATVDEIRDADARKPKIVKAGKDEISALALIIATGAAPNRLGIPGEDKFWGKGISTCATCDGFFYKGKDIVVIGGGDASVEESTFLLKFVNTLTLVHRRDKLRAQKVLQDRLIAAGDRVTFEWKMKPKEFVGGDKFEKLVVEHVETGEAKELAPAGVFLFIGLHPNTAFLKGTVEMDAEGFVTTDPVTLAASCPGVFAAGDVRKKLLRQIVTACGEGGTAAYAARQYVEELKGQAYK